MCGIAGILTSAPNHGPLREQVERMASAMVHRGPDDSGTWSDEERGIALGFRRLAILDLTPTGHQPMRSASGRFWMIFNGEVFNFRELRAELADYPYRGHSDTEVILAAFERWGIARAVTRFVGMFAIAVWDTQERRLSLIRDRLGIKPVFVYAEPGLVTFGSELKALVAGPSFNRELDLTAVSEYLRYLYVPGPRSIYQHVKKLRPGHILTLSLDDTRGALPESVPYWSVEAVAAAGLGARFQGDEREAVDEFDRLLTDSVRLRMESDVPLGALLSGGLDSSTVVALLQEHATRPVKTFSIAFDDAVHNEADHAAAVARHLGTDHTEVMLTGHDALAVVPKLAEVFDEPHADTSQVPAYLICGVARRDVTVALSGDGGDEVYGGYNRYTYGEALLQRMLAVPRPARHLVARGIGGLSADSWNRAHRFASPVLPRSLRQRLPGEKIHKIGRMLAADGAPRMYSAMVSAWPEPSALVRGGAAVEDPMQRVLGESTPTRLLDRMMLADQLTYLVDDQLAKVDRVSMAVSLEVRVPLLDHRLVEFSWKLPTALKMRPGQGKWILRQVLYRRVPRELVERPKMGLSVPLGAWLRGPLRPWAADLLDAERLERDGVLRSAPIVTAWRALLAGRDEHALGLWAVLMFQAWRDRWIS